MMKKALALTVRPTESRTTLACAGPFWCRSSEGGMRKMISKATVAAVAALSLCAALVASTEPAAAAFRMGGGGFGGGMGGWRGGWGGYGYRGYGYGGYGGYGYGLGLGYGLALGYP